MVEQWTANCKMSIKKHQTTHNGHFFDIMKIIVSVRIRNVVLNPLVEGSSPFKPAKYRRMCKIHRNAELIQW